MTGLRPEEEIPRSRIRDDRRDVPPHALLPIDGGAAVSGAGDDGRRRFPRRVYEVGGEPDPRFSLANERTFLAWIRTSLALVAGGVALDAVALPLLPGTRVAAAGVLLLLGLLTPLLSWYSWARTERALRRGGALPSSAVTTLPLAVGIVLVAVLVVVGAVLP